MFVESMSFEEIRKEMDLDKMYFISKVTHHSEDVLKHMKRTNMTKYEKYFEYVSPRKNRWVYRFYTTTGKRNDFHIHNYCCFMTRRSYAVLTYFVLTDEVHYFTSHFFTRYFERLDHKKDAVHDIIRMFLRENESIAMQPIKDLGKGVYQVFAQLTTGVGLGYNHHGLKLTEMRTFITNDMLKKDQLELSKQLEEKFKMHVVREKPEE